MTHGGGPDRHGLCIAERACIVLVFLGRGVRPLQDIASTHRLARVWYVLYIASMCKEKTPFAPRPATRRD